MGQTPFADANMELFEEKLKELREAVNTNQLERASEIIDSLESDSDCACGKLIESFRAGLLFIITGPESRAQIRANNLVSEINYYLNQVIPQLKETDADGN